MKEKLFSKKIKKRYILLGVILVIAAIASVLYMKRNQILPAAAYYLLTEVPAPTAQDRIMVISPHPDDETLGAGGFIARAHATGAEVTVVIATDGNRRGLKDMRHEEALTALGILGITPDHIYFLDYPDGNLRAHKAEFAAKITELIQRLQPTILLGTHPADTHVDHAVVGQVINELVPHVSPQPQVYEFLVHYHRYPRPEGYHPMDYLLPPARLILVSMPWQKFALNDAEQSIKNQAVRAYKSQLSYKNIFLRELLLSFVRQNELFVIQK